MSFFDYPFNKLAIPSDCYLCHQSIDVSASVSSLLCRFCFDRLPRLNFGCPICAMPLTAAEEDLTHSECSSFLSSPTICGDCLKSAPNYHKTIVAFHYEPPISDFITHLKYQAQLHLVPLLSQSLQAAVLQQTTPENYPEVLVPVPLYSKKIRQRGFNQSQLLAQSIGKRLNIPVDNYLAQRVRNTQAQSTLDANQRHQNLKGAFKVSQKTLKHVAIVDDVITTGATANSLAAELTRSGVEKVEVWSVARAFW